MQYLPLALFILLNLVVLAGIVGGLWYLVRRIRGK